MSVPVNIPLSGGASPWLVFGPMLPFAVTGGWAMARLDRRLVFKKAEVRAIARPAEKTAPKAA
jgi:hypothetical protein